MVALLRIIGIAACLLLVGNQVFVKKESSAPDSILNFVRSYVLSRDAASKALSFLTASPHPMGSPRQEEVRNYLVTQLRSLGLDPQIQTFTVQTPNKSADQLLAPLTVYKKASNVLVRLKLVEKPSCLIALGSHYDTKDVDGISFVGANDSGSSSVLLLDIARFLLKNRTPSQACDVQLIWFDGEESVLPEWNDALTKHPARIVDNTYGSRHLAQSLEKCSEKTNPPLLALLVLDMVGFHELKLTLDKNSHPALNALLLSAADSLGKKDLLRPSFSQAVADDQMAFKERGVPVLNIIDFNHRDLWHTSLDRFESVSMDSLELSGKLALYVLLNLQFKTDDLRYSVLCFPKY